MISHHIAMVYAMVVGAAADGSLAESELETIRGIVEGLPIFEEFEKGNLVQIAAAATDLLTEEDGLDTVIDQIKRNLTPRLCATAYALACDVVAADGEATQEELRYLEMLRHELEVDRLTAAAIERGAAARYARA
ncbi:MAG: tellurite resistance TerB family protein [Alphaproteobacteria bacterium]|nr:tellurite resistance TerB family protein [Alphaproteobacteria bacterium]